MRLHRIPTAVLFALCLCLRPGGALGQSQNPAVNQHWKEGARQYEAHHYERALRAYERAYGIEPIPLLLLNIGNSYLMLGQPEEALTHYVRYLELERERPEAEKMGRLGNLFAQALDRVQERGALGQVPLTPGRLLLIGKARDHLGQPDEALRNYERAFAQGQAVSEDERQQLLQATAQALDRLDPDGNAAARGSDAGRLLLLGRGRYRLGQGESALRLYQRALVVTPHPDPARREQLAGYVSDNDALLLDRIRAGSTRPELLLGMAQLRLSLGDAPGALQILHSFREREPLPDMATKAEVDATVKRACGQLDPSEQAQHHDVCRAPLRATALPGAHPQPVYKKWWLWTIVGVVAAGAVIGAVAGAEAARPPSPRGPVVDLP